MNFDFVVFCSPFLAEQFGGIPQLTAEPRDLYLTSTTKSEFHGFVLFCFIPQNDHSALLLFRRK